MARESRYSGKLGVSECEVCLMVDCKMMVRMQERKSKITADATDLVL